MTTIGVTQRHRSDVPASGNSALDAEYLLLPPRVRARFQRTSSPDADESARGPARQQTHEHASLSQLAQAVKRWARYKYGNTAGNSQ
jgi:hypothetical protein